MATLELIANTISPPASPAIPGLTFRRFRGESDYPDMAAVCNASREADLEERVQSAEDWAHEFAHPANYDPRADTIFVEVDGQLVGWGLVTWRETGDGERLYQLWAFLHPDWRRKGIGRAMLLWQEWRLREIAASQREDGPRFYATWASETALGKVAMLQREGYAPARYFYEMVRPSLDDIPNAPMPLGLEGRTAKPETYRTIWEASVEAFSDEWGEWIQTEADYQNWLGSSEFQPGVWKVAWDVETDQVAGMVLGFIDDKQNLRYNRRRGWTENICVRRPWRKRGVASALIAENLRELKARGMTEAALGVDTENPTGALRLYERMGFRATRRSAHYRKPLIADRISPIAS